MALVIELLVEAKSQIQQEAPEHKLIINESQCFDIEPKPLQQADCISLLSPSYNAGNKFITLLLKSGIDEGIAAV